MEHRYLYIPGISVIKSALTYMLIKIIESREFGLLSDDISIIYGIC